VEAVVRAFALRRVPTSQLRRDLGLARLMRRFSLQQVEGITASREGGRDALCPAAGQ